MMDRPTLATGVLITLLALGHGALAWHSTTHRSPTVDETGHLAAARAVGALGDRRCITEHPLLAFRLAGCTAPDLPLPTDAPEWARGEGWTVGRTMLTRWQAAGGDPHAAILAARVVPTLWGVGLVVLCGVWAWRWYGRGAGVAAASLAAFAPTLLAHGPLLTTDVPAAVTQTLAVLALGAALARPATRTIALAALAIGVALATKYSAGLLGPFGVLLAAWRAARAPLGTRCRTLGRGLGVMAIACVGALPVLWACYGLTGTVSPDPAFVPAWDTTVVGGFAGGVLRALSSAHVVPEAWAYGLGRMLAQVPDRVSYLLGETYEGGRLAYFPVAFLVKETPAVLALLGLSIACRDRRPTPDGRGDAPVTWIAVYGGVAMLVGLNLGIRHLLPLLPAVYVQASRAVGLASRGRLAIAGLACLLAGHIASAVAIHPYPIAYFNVLGGGPDGGRHVLVDSNLDWGQDLPALRDWMAAERVESVALQYFGTADPAWYGIKHAALLARMPDGSIARAAAPVVVISATALQGSLHLEDPRLLEAFGPYLTRPPTLSLGHSLLVWDARRR